MLDLAEKWFAPLADRTVASQPIPREPQQEAPRRETVERDVPATTLSLAFHMGGRTRRISIPPTWSPTSCRAATRRVSTNTWCRNSACWPRSTPHISGDVDPGLFVFTGATAAGYHSRTGRSGFPCRNRGIAERPGIGLRGREGQKQVRGQHALRRAERDEQGDEPGLLRDAGRPAAHQRRGGGLPCRHDRRHPRLQPPHLPPRNCSILIYKAKK